MPLFQPADTAEVGQVIAWAAGERAAIDIVGGGSKRGLGRPTTAPHTLQLSRLAGIIDYDPAELVLSAHAATPLAAIDAALSASQQMLAFEPADWRSLLDGDGTPTLGGTLACNIAGPRRVRAGAARDHFLGVTAVNGRGEVWKAGGRVVKNVTGYDMCKLQAGAYGTLSVMTEVAVRVVPRPETTCSLLVFGHGEARAVALMAEALNTPWEVSAAAHLPAPAARRSGVAAVADGGGAVTVLRLEGYAASVNFRATTLAAALAADGRLDHADSARVWHEIAAVGPLLAPDDRCIWRLCPVPSTAATVTDRLRRHFASTDVYYDWGGGLVWLSLDAAEAGPDGGSAIVRGGGLGGHATLIGAAAPLRSRAPVFEPSEGALASLARRVKAAFDPHGILNPGRLHEGM